MKAISRRAFVTAALATATAAVAWTPATSAIVMSMDLAEPGQDRVAVWLVSYKQRCHDMQAIVTQMSDGVGWDRLDNAIGDGIGTQTLAETRESLKQFEELEGRVRDWWTHRTAVGTWQARGYGAGRYNDKVERPDKSEGDRDFAFWNGYYLGRADRERYGR